MGYRKRKHCCGYKKAKCHQYYGYFEHGCDDDPKCEEGHASVSQSVCTGTINGTINLLVPISLNLGDATVFNRSNANGYNNTA